MPEDFNQPPPEPPLAPLALEWLTFSNGVRSLLVPQTDDRPLDQYLGFRDKVMELVQNREFLNAINQVWNGQFASPPSIDPAQQEALDTLVMELKAFTLALEVAQATEKTEDSKRWWSKLLGRASTTVGSVKDVLDKLLPEMPWYLKSSVTCGLTLFKELIDIFRAKD
jgi:hypothetical protein